jgi:hypothetical protein
MKASARKIDGYSISNTKHVLHALRAYELKVAKSSKGDAEKAAIEGYANVSGRRVTGRAVRLWLAVVKSYGGIGNVPENAFGARKSCPHVARPIRDLLRQIEVEADRIKKEPGKENFVNPQIAVEVALVDRDMEALAARVQNDPLRYRVASIRRMARRMRNMPPHRLHQFMAEPELFATLTGLLSRMKGVALKRAERAA